MLHMKSAAEKNKAESGGYERKSSLTFEGKFEDEGVTWIVEGGAF